MKITGGLALPFVFLFGEPFAGLRPCTPPGSLTLDPVAEGIGMSNKHFPAVAWGTLRGVAPSTPSRAIGPAPSSGTYSSYLTNNFPLAQEKPADASRKRLPCGGRILKEPFIQQQTNGHPTFGCPFAYVVPKRNAPEWCV